MKKDKLVQRGGGGFGNIDEQLDNMIDENFRLQEEERGLMTAVKKLQANRQATAGSTKSSKKLTKTLG